MKQSGNHRRWERNKERQFKATQDTRGKKTNSDNNTEDHMENINWKFKPVVNNMPYDQ